MRYWAPMVGQGSISGTALMSGFSEKRVLNVVRDGDDLEIVSFKSANGSSCLRRPRGFYRETPREPRQRGRGAQKVMKADVGRVGPSLAHVTVEEEPKFVSTQTWFKPAGNEAWIAPIWYTVCPKRII